MARILIVYSTTDGHTLKICERLRASLNSNAHQVTLRPVADTEQITFDAFDKVVVGASIRYGKHKPEVSEFIARHQAALEARPAAFFSVNVVARKTEKNTAQTNPDVRKFLRGIDWCPQHVAVFAGRIDYPRYRFLDRNMIRLIMWLTGGPTDTRGTFDFTDWAQVDAFAAHIDRM